LRRLRFLTAGDLALAAQAVRSVLAADGVVLLPTETFYGLGACPTSRLALAKVCAMKGRPEELALPVLCADWQQVESLVEVPEVHRSRLESVWPGPLTAVMRCAVPLPAAVAGTLAVRVPGHPLLRSLLATVGPLTGTSANRHGEDPCTGVTAALESLHQSPDLVLEGGVTTGGAASTVVDLTRQSAVVLRWGASGW